MHTQISVIPFLSLSRPKFPAFLMIVVVPVKWEERITSNKKRALSSPQELNAMTSHARVRRFTITHVCVNLKLGIDRMRVF